jgi:hypothetical protein
MDGRSRAKPHPIAASPSPEGVVVRSWSHNPGGLRGRHSSDDRGSFLPPLPGSQLQVTQPAEGAGAGPEEQGLPGRPGGDIPGKLSDALGLPEDGCGAVLGIRVRGRSTSDYRRGRPAARNRRWAFCGPIGASAVPREPNGRMTSSRRPGDSTCPTPQRTPATGIREFPRLPRQQRGPMVIRRPL